MAKITAIGGQVLASRPDANSARLSAAGVQTLAQLVYPPRVPAIRQEVLVYGAKPINVNLSTVGAQILAEPPRSPLSVASVRQEVLVQGDRPVTARMSSAAAQVLFRTPPSNYNVHTAYQEVLVFQRTSMAPGRAFFMGASTIVGNTGPYLDPSIPQSEVSAHLLLQTNALATEYVDPGAPFRAMQSTASVLAPSSILDYQTAGRAYHTTASFMADVDYLPPSTARSDLFVSMGIQTMALADVVNPTLSDARVSGVGASAVFDAQYDAPANVGSELWVEALRQTMALADELRSKDDVIGDLFVDHAAQASGLRADYLDKGLAQADLDATYLDQRLIVDADYLDKGLAQSTMDVSALLQSTGAAAVYPDPATVVPDWRLYAAGASALVPANWVGLQQTKLRQHLLHGAVLTRPVEGRYPDPSVIQAPLYSTHLDQRVAFSTDEGASSAGSDARVTRLDQRIAVRADYSFGDATSMVTVTDLMLLSVERDEDFDPVGEEKGVSPPMTAVILTYD